MNDADTFSLLLRLLIVAVASGSLSYFIGYRAGHKRGQDEGWLDRYFKDAADDRARRDRLGRFRDKNRA